MVMQRQDWESKDFIYSESYPKLMVEEMEIIPIKFVGKNQCITSYKHLIYF